MDAWKDDSMLTVFGLLDECKGKDEGARPERSTSNTDLTLQKDETAS
jgi:hypothetical protein